MNKSDCSVKQYLVEFRIFFNQAEMKALERISFRYSHKNRLYFDIILNRGLFKPFGFFLSSQCFGSFPSCRKNKNTDGQKLPLLHYMYISAWRFSL